MISDLEYYRVKDNVNSYYRIESESKKELLLNKYPNAAAAYSLRLLDGYYRGPLVRVRRDDGVEVDVYPDYNNQLSLDSLVTNVPVHTTNDGIPDTDYTFQLSLSSLGEFVGATGYSSTVAATDATVCVWYDQSSTDGVPNSNDAKQVTATSQPLIVSSGVIVTENGKPALQFDGTDDGYSLNTTGLDVGSLSSFTVGRMITISNAVMLALSGTIDNKRWYAPFISTGNFNYGYATSPTAISTAQDTNQNLHTMIAGTTLGGVEAWKNGTSAGTTTRTTGIDSTANGIANFIGGFRANCRMQEVVYYGSDQSTNRTGIEEDINSFYQIDGYTPTPKLIDLTQDLAVQNGGTIADGTPAAAYSLRLLSSTYNGPLVRIRRTIDNTEVDVYPDSDGEFSIYSTIEDGGTELTTGVTGGSTDKTTLHEFLYGQDTDCMVVVWYDQSGNANDATQTTTTNQPKIYDSVTGVVTDGDGNKTLQFDTTDKYENIVTLDNDPIFATAVAQMPNGNKRQIWGLGAALAFLHLESFAFTTKMHRLSFGDGVAFTGYNGTANADTNVHLFTSSKISNAVAGYLDGSADITGTETKNSSASLSIAAREFNQTINITELIVWQSDQSSNRSNIESNINQHYNIY